MKELEQKYIDILKENDWSISSYTDDGKVEVQKYSPAGEDFLMCVEVENFPESVRVCANNFDADEHATMWIEARGRVGGVPNSIRELIDDAEAIQEMLNELADALEEKMEKENTVWTLFVLDFDGTYDNEYYGEYGERPAVYQIPLEKQKEVEKIAKKASMEFNISDDVCEPICDIFDGLLEENNIKYHCIGNLKIKFGDRQENYLDECIPRQIV